MSEEEKKAMKFFYNLRATIDESNMLFDEDLNVKCGKETIKHITKVLSLIEKLQKENEEWREAYQEEKDKQFELIQNTNNTIKTANIAIKDLQEKLKEVITVQKIKDKIEELNKKEQKLQNSISAEEREEYSDANISWDLMDINIKREVLQDLIEGRK